MMHPCDDELVCTPIQHNGNTTLNLEDVRSFTFLFGTHIVMKLLLSSFGIHTFVLRCSNNVKFFTINTEMLLTEFFSLANFNDDDSNRHELNDM